MSTDVITEETTSYLRDTIIIKSTAILLKIRKERINTTSYKLLTIPTSTKLTQPTKTRTSVSPIFTEKRRNAVRTQEQTKGR